MGNRIPSYIIFLAVYVFFYAGCKKADKPAILLSDIDGNTYKTIKIGNQLWMAENLKTTRFSDGTNIPLVIDADSWGNLTTPGYCWYNNDAPSFIDSYGALYNNFTVNTGNLCPSGWHVPEREEWLELRDFLGDSLIAGGKLKEAGTAHWLSPNTGADNSSGFTAEGAGLRYLEGTFSSVLSFASFWSATAADNDDEWYIGLYFADASFISDHRNKKNGFSVRCLKD
jgi:uncharacterized protein (TIGR02145 family)